MRRISLVCASLLLAVAAFGKTIKHPHCNVYLLSSNEDELSAWARFEKVFVDKGYTPIDMEPPRLKENSLVATIHYQLLPPSMGPRFGLQKHKCIVTFRIDKVIQEKPFHFGPLFLEEKSKTARRFGVELPEPNCPTEKVIRAMPKCEISK